MGLEASSLVVWLGLVLGAAGGPVLLAGEREPAQAPRPPFRFVHLSDLHCGHATANPPGRFPLDPNRKDVVRSFKLLDAAVRRINKEVRPAFVVITGDLVDSPADLDSLRRVKAILDGLACPYYPVIGDHDSRGNWRSVFGQERLNYTFSHGGWRFVAADSNPGCFDEATLAWLRRTLEADATTPTALFTHRPVVVPQAHVLAAKRLYGTSLALGNAAAAIALLSQHGNVRAVFAGHCHVGIECEGAGRTHYVAPSLVAPGHFFSVVQVRGTALQVELQALEP